MNMYKFGNYICKLREEKSLTQADLAKLLDVSDKSISKWENGQAFPRIETFEKLAFSLDTTVEDIFSASKDGVKRICIANNLYYIMQVDVDGQVHSIRADESKWIEINDATDSVVIKVTGDFLTDEAFEDLDSSTSALKEKLMYKFVKKATTELMDVILQVDCVYKISNISPECLITVEDDSFDLGDKTWMMQDFQIMYPKLICNGDIKVELLSAKGKNSKEVIKQYKKMGLLSDMGLDFITMFLAYPLRGLYFKHLCKPSVLKKNILNVEVHKANTQKRNSGKRIGCIGECFSLIAVVLLFFILDAFVFSVLFVSSEKPYLVASDYSTVTFGDDVYVRIDELPDYAYPTTF